MSEINMASLYESYTAKSLVDAATKNETVPTGSYTLSVLEVAPKVGDEKAFVGPGREYATIRGRYVKEDGLYIGGTAWIDVSWEEWHSIEDENGKYIKTAPSDPRWFPGQKLDSAAKLWGQIEKTVNPQKKMSIGQVLESLSGTYFRTFVTETFKDGDGQYHSVDKTVGKDAESSVKVDARNEFIKAGWTAYNNVVTIGKVK